MSTMLGLHLRSLLRRRLLRRRLKLIRLIVCDVDGVLTDGGLLYDTEGGVLKRFDVRDGLAVRMLQRANITVAILSGGRAGAIEHRARHLGIDHCLVGVSDKRDGLEQLQRKLAIIREQTLFVGDDINDLAVRSLSGVLAVPSDAVFALRRHADWVLKRRGGEGVLRELSDAVLESQGKLQQMNIDGWRVVND